MKKVTSAYSKMYLVTPSVYQILKNCISDKEKTITDNLNVTETPVELTPADKMVAEIAQKDFNEPSVATQIVEEQIAPPQITNPSDVIFSESFPSVPKEQIVYSNPLTTPCNQDSPEGQIIPSMLYKTKTNMPEVMQKSRFIIPTKVSTPSQCNVCMKTFSRKWDLKRHLNSVHRNMINPQMESSPEIVDVGEEDIEEQPKSKSFDNWSAGTTRSGRSFVNMDTSTPSLRGKRSAKKAKLGNVQIPSKLRPPGGEESLDSFEHWA